MAKSKKDIDAFQKAMLSNTKIIGKELDEISDTEEEVSSAQKDKSVTKPKEKPEFVSEKIKEDQKTSEKIKESPIAHEKKKNLSIFEPVKKEGGVSIEINKELYEKYKKLTDYHEIDLNKFIEIGLNLFIKLEHHWFSEKY